MGGYFQDLYGFELIGAGNRANGIYYLVSSTACKSSRNCVEGNKGISEYEAPDCNTVENMMDINDVNMISLPNKSATKCESK